MLRRKSEGSRNAWPGGGLAYMPGLDGLRAVSILGVLTYHGGFSWAGGGVISVSVFFVLSGFLITTLLLKEWDFSGTIKLLAFWGRRARRLLPALFFLLAVVAFYIWFLAPTGTQQEFRGDALSTLLYFGNWHQIASGQSYFATVSAPSPVLHTWSLAIEEQFYLVWPLVVLGILKLWHSTRTLLWVALAGALASAVEMAILFHPGADPSRLYYGTDTRAQDILVGAVVAIVLIRLNGSKPLRQCGREKEQAQDQPSARPCSPWAWVAAIAMAVYAWEWLTITGTSSWLYRGGFLLCDVAVALVIAAVVLAPGCWPIRLLSIRPLRYIGRISYGLYLWHWPIFLMLDHERTGLLGWPLFGLRVAVTFAVAMVSWYFVELPIRRMDFRAWRFWSWLSVGAATTAGLLFLSTVGAAASSGALSIGPGEPQASKIAYWVVNYPKHTKLKRVLFVGDSLSIYTAYHLAPYAAHFGLIIGGRAQSGCGIATAEPDNVHGSVQYSIVPCQNEPSYWQTDVDRFHPSVAVLVVGFWETLDRLYQGRWQHLGDPAFDAYETAQFNHAVSVLSSRGAQVALMTAPFNNTGEQPNGQPWDEDSPARIKELNRIIEAVAARHRGVVSVIPLNKILDPHGHFTWKIDGKTVRLSDGIHSTAAAGKLEAPIILPQLAEMAKKARPT